MLHFCTYFDRNYLSRGLALHQSLQQRCPAFKLWVLCMDDGAHRSLTQLNLPEIEPIALQDFEKGDGPLLEAKRNRSQIEYYFTCTPSLPLYILRKWPEVEMVTYLDADLYFFGSPAPLFEEMGAGSVAIIGHRFPEQYRHLEKWGVYNVGWLSFRRDDVGIACLKSWREQCLEWCHDWVENGRFADQKYLDDWPDRFQGVVVLQHKGANLAPWNLPNFRLCMSNAANVVVDGEPLIFFHFHSLKKRCPWVYDPEWKRYGVKPTALLRRRVYIPYLQTIEKENRKLMAAVGGDAACQGVRGKANGKQSLASKARRLATTVEDMPSIAAGLVRGNYFFVVNGHYY